MSPSPGPILAMAAAAPDRGRDKVQTCHTKQNSQDPKRHDEEDKKHHNRIQHVFGHWPTIIARCEDTAWCVDF